MRILCYPFLILLNSVLGVIFLVSRTTSKIAALNALAPSLNNRTIIPELYGRMDAPDTTSVLLDKIEFRTSLIDFTTVLGQE
jgi:hypothetical protein